MSMKHLKELLVAKGKTLIELANVLGGDKSAITNLLQGKRQLKAKEVPLIAAFLEVSEAQVLGVQEAAPATEDVTVPSGLAEPAALPFYGVPSDALLRSGKVVQRDGGYFVEMTEEPQKAYVLEVKDRGLDLAGLMPGDLMICDPTRKPRKNDVVIVQVYADDGSAETGVRLYDSPFLKAHSSEAGHQQLHEERANIAIVSPVIRLVRLY